MAVEENPFDTGVLLMYTSTTVNVDVGQRIYHGLHSKYSLTRKSGKIRDLKSQRHTPGSIKPRPVSVKVTWVDFRNGPRYLSVILQEHTDSVVQLNNRTSLEDVGITLQMDG